MALQFFTTLGGVYFVGILFLFAYLIWRELKSDI